MKLRNIYKIIIVFFTMSMIIFSTVIVKAENTESEELKSGDELEIEKIEDESEKNNQLTEKKEYAFVDDWSGLLHVQYNLSVVRYFDFTNLTYDSSIPVEGILIHTIRCGYINQNFGFDGFIGFPYATIDPGEITFNPQVPKKSEAETSIFGFNFGGRAFYNYPINEYFSLFGGGGIEHLTLYTELNSGQSFQQYSYVYSLNIFISLGVHAKYDWFIFSFEYKLSPGFASYTWETIKDNEDLITFNSNDSGQTGNHSFTFGAGYMF